MVFKIINFMPESLKKLINLISFLPGIGEKSATKLAFFLLNSNKNYLENLSNSLLNLKESISKCEICNCLIDKNKNICEICSSSNRNKNIICVVEEYLDMISIENSKVFDGVYHILGGAISPMNGIFIGDLNFESLFKKVSNSQENIELIMATNPNIEGEATVAYIIGEIEKRGLKKFIKLTRLSRGLSSGYIEYADNITLINSIKERKEI
ncbi:MAG: recombination mediator RecR [Candidatus Gracilibacteria bacterium]|nr:recombination mediator RecR [Candidatus Gracilibacteria bacterium]